MQTKPHLLFQDKIAILPATEEDKKSTKVNEWGNKKKKKINLILCHRKKEKVRQKAKGKSKGQAKILHTSEYQLRIVVTIKTSNSIFIFDGVVSMLSSSFGFPWDKNATAEDSIFISMM